MAAACGRSTRSLEGMSEPAEKSSINRHFRREGILQLAIGGAIVVAAALMALVGPWLYEHFL